MEVSLAKFVILEKALMLKYYKPAVKCTNYSYGYFSLAKKMYKLFSLA